MITVLANRPLLSGPKGVDMGALKPEINLLRSTRKGLVHVPGLAHFEGMLQKKVQFQESVSVTRGGAKPSLWILEGTFVWSVIVVCLCDLLLCFCFITKASARPERARTLFSCPVPAPPP